MKALFVYESKMSLINQIASSRSGAELLLQHGTLARLGNMQVLDCHPDIQGGSQTTRDFIPSVASRYRQILTPALALCDALITSLGSENHSCLLQITQFLLSHSETVESILRAGGPMVSIGLLLELESLTSVIARSSNQQVFSSVSSETALQESVVSVYRIQKLMLALFPRFTLSDGLLRDMTENSKNIFNLNDDETNPDSGINRVSLYFKVMSNLTCYARKITASHGVDHGSIGAVFRPVLSSGSLDRRGQWANQSSDTSPHLGILIQQLVASVMHFNREKLALELMMRKLKSVPDMSAIELEELVPRDILEGSINENKLVTFERLASRVKDKKREMEDIRFVVDHCLYLIWAHLDFYMLRVVPLNGGNFNQNAATNKCG